MESLKNRFPIKSLCKVLGISRASYYKWCHRETPEYEVFNNNLRDEILRIYHKYNGIYGYRRIYIYLRLYTRFQVNHKRVQRIMKRSGLKAVIRQSRRSYKPSTPEITALNVVNREFDRSDKTPVWLTDVTEIKLRNGQKVYLSAIYDLQSKKILSHEISKRNNNELVFHTLKKAQALYDTEGIILHSDRGFQYTSRAFRQKLRAAGMTQSMSRVGRCIDNGPMEGFFGLLKSEIFKGKSKIFDDYDHAEKELTKYIKFFNKERISLKMAALIQAQPSN